MQNLQLNYKLSQFKLSGLVSHPDKDLSLSDGAETPSRS